MTRSTRGWDGGEEVLRLPRLCRYLLGLEVNKVKGLGIVKLVAQNRKIALVPTTTKMTMAASKDEDWDAASRWWSDAFLNISTMVPVGDL